MNTSHLIDALKYVTGLTVTSVSAEIGTTVADVDVEDMAAATFQFDNGAVGSLIAGAHIIGAHNEEVSTIYGTQGQIRLPDPYSSDPMQVYLKRNWDDFEAGQWHTLGMERIPVYVRAIEDFAVSVQSGQCAIVNGNDARYVLSVVLAIYQSAKERKMISVS